MKYGHDLSYADRREIEDKVSTENIINFAAQQAGVLTKKEHIDFTARDATYREVVEAQNPHPFSSNAHEVGPSALHTGYDVAEIFAEHAVEGAVGAAAPFVGAGGFVIQVKETVEALPRAWENGDRRKEALLQDGLHLALVSRLKGLPQDYVAKCVQERRDAAGGATQLLTQNRLDANPTLREVLQIRCDEGMKAAEQAFVQGEGTQRFLQVHPGIQRRYESDAAFRAGFDALVFAHGQGEKPFQDTLAQLHARDARFSTSNTIWQQV